MAYLDDFLRRTQTASTPVLPVGPDLQAAPTAMSSPPILSGGAGAPGRSGSPDLTASMGQLGTAIGGRMGQPKTGRDSRGRQMGDFPRRSPFQNPATMMSLDSAMMAA